MPIDLDTVGVGTQIVAKIAALELDYQCLNFHLGP